MERSMVLGIDTCTRWLNLALVEDGGAVVGEVHEEVATHTTRLVPALDALLVSCAVGRADLSATGVIVGPGSFTGLRVGLAAALGLAKALTIPVFGLDSLTALARAAAGEGEGVALLDARRSQVYARWFVRQGGEAAPLGEPKALSPVELLQDGTVPAWASGDGVPLVPHWPPSVVLNPRIPNLAVPAARSALEALKAGKPGEEPQPLYVRPPDARKG